VIPLRVNVDIGNIGANQTSRVKKKKKKKYYLSRLCFSSPKILGAISFEPEHKTFHRQPPLWSLPIQTKRRVKM